MITSSLTKAKQLFLIRLLALSFIKESFLHTNLPW